MNTRVALITLAAATSLATPAYAIEYFCQPQNLCEWVPTDGSGTPAYHHGDGTAPWVIGGSDIVQLPAGDYEVGTDPNLGFPVIFVLDDATLAIEDVTGEVGIGAWIMLCDNATFRVRNAAFRSLASFPFQFPIFAMGQSHIEYEQASFYTLLPAYESAGYRGALFQVMGDQSTLTVTPGATHGVVFPTLGDAWELAVVHEANADIRSIDVFGKFYIAGQASFHIEDAQYHDMFFEACPGDSYALDGLPELCDLQDPATQCVTPNHPPIDFHTAPPATPFTLDLVHDKVFAWAASTYEGSSIDVSNVPVKANFAVGLGGIHQDLEMKLGPGNPPVMEGVTDRTLTFDDAFVGGWMVWPVGTSHIKLLDGSEVGDLLPGDQSISEAYGTLFTGAMFDAAPGTEVHLFDCTLDERATNSGGKLWATTSTLEAEMAIAGATWLADVTENGTLELREGGVVHRVSISSPQAGAEISSGPVPIAGSVLAEDPNGVPFPFPAATLEAVEATTGTSHPIATIDAPVEGDALAQWNIEGLEPGDYDLRLFFGGEGESAVSVRRVSILGSDSTDAGADASPEDAGPTADAAETGPETEAGAAGAGTAPSSGEDDSGCGCSTPGARAPGLPSAAWLGLLALAMRGRLSRR